MKCDFDIIHDRKNTDSLKWDYAEKIFNEKDVLPMWVADMDFLSPVKVIDAIKKRSEHGIFGYMGNMSESYCNSIITWVKKRHGWEIKSEWLCHTPGVLPALSTAILAYTKPGDKIVVQSPVYPPFYSLVKNNGRVLVDNPLVFKNSCYEMDFADLKTKLEADAKMMILCSPHNPVGRVWRKDELLEVGELCSKNGIILASDEIHSDIVYSGYKHIPAASLSDGLARSSITCIAASKTFGIAGLATSAVIIPDPQLRKRFRYNIENMGLGMGNIFGTVATKAAYDYGEEWLEKLMNYLQENLQLLTDYFDENIPEIRVIKPEGTYLVWLDCSKLGFNQKELLEFMVRKAKVGLNDGATFGIGGEGFLRINIACPRATLFEGLSRIERAVDSIRI